eukprot:COSAG02_NODE_3017_length_7545_cov_4.558286_3_plen_151_part_00
MCCDVCAVKGRMPPSLKAAAMAISAAQTGEAVKVRSSCCISSPSARVERSQAGCVRKWALRKVAHAHFNANANRDMGAPALIGLGRAGSARPGPAHMPHAMPRRAHLLSSPTLCRSWCGAARVQYTRLYALHGRFGSDCYRARSHSRMPS